MVRRGGERAVTERHVVRFDVAVRVQRGGGSSPDGHNPEGDGAGIGGGFHEACTGQIHVPGRDIAVCVQRHHRTNRFRNIAHDDTAIHGQRVQHTGAQLCVARRDAAFRGEFGVGAVDFGEISNRDVVERLKDDPAPVQRHIAGFDIGSKDIVRMRLKPDLRSVGACQVSEDDAAVVRIGGERTPIQGAVAGVDEIIGGQIEAGAMGDGAFHGLAQPQVAQCDGAACGGSHRAGVQIHAEAIGRDDPDVPVRDQHDVRALHTGKHRHGDVASCRQADEAVHNVQPLAAGDILLRMQRHRGRIAGGGIRNGEVRKQDAARQRLGFQRHALDVGAGLKGEVAEHGFEVGVRHEQLVAVKIAEHHKAVHDDGKRIGLRADRGGGGGDQREVARCINVGRGFIGPAIQDRALGIGHFKGYIASRDIAQEVGRRRHLDGGLLTDGAARHHNPTTHADGRPVGQRVHDIHDLAVVFGAVGDHGGHDGQDAGDCHGGHVAVRGFSGVLVDREAGHMLRAGGDQAGVDQRPDAGALQVIAALRVHGDAAVGIARQALEHHQLRGACAAVDLVNGNRGREGGRIERVEQVGHGQLIGLVDAAIEHSRKPGVTGNHRDVELAIVRAALVGDALRREHHGGAIHVDVHRGGDAVAVAGLDMV